MTSQKPKTLCDAALTVLNTADAHEKAKKTRAFATLWRGKDITDLGGVQDMPDRPARPYKPELLMPRDMPKRKKGDSDQNKINLLHALSHIELNAIDLAWDIIGRFSYYYKKNTSSPRSALADINSGDPEDAFSKAEHNMDPVRVSSRRSHQRNDASFFTLPIDFYNDWLKVADDEAKHFLMLSDRLADFNASYGDLPAHDGLWESATKTAKDFAARLAIVPMVLEARGLDVTPNMIELMTAQGDTKTADMLKIIHDDEITHVAAGTVWFKKWCDHFGHNQEDYFQALVRQYFNATLKKPFNHPSREEAGMIRDWYEPLAESA